MTAIRMKQASVNLINKIDDSNTALIKKVYYFLSMLAMPDMDVKLRGLDYQEMIKRLSDFQEYEQGWDGNDAMPLSADVVKNFKLVLEESTDDMLAGWTIFPAANGSLLLEYKPCEAGINIGRDDYSYYFFNNGVANGKNHQAFSPEAIIKTMQDIAYAQ